MTTKFTPGPWMSKRHDGTGRVMEFKREFWEVGGGPDKAGVAFVFKGQANANLIAAAPEMYEALKLGSSKHVCCCGPRDAEKCLKCTFEAALAKADGGQQ